MPAALCTHPPRSDGSNDNFSWNCGVEGPTDNPAILALRQRQVCGASASLAWAQGGIAIALS